MIDLVPVRLKKCFAGNIEIRLAYPLFFFVLYGHCLDTKMGKTNLLRTNLKTNNL